MNPTLIFSLKIAAIVVVSYFIGNIQGAAFIAKKKGTDIRNVGSGNPGTINMLRNFGVKTAFLTLFLDALKGIVPAIGAYFLMQIGPSFGTEVSAAAPGLLGYYTNGVGKLAMLIAGLSAVVGHVFPVFKHFKGGKGVATCMGVFLVTDPLIMLGVFVIAFLYLYIGKYGSVASFICIITMTAVEVVFAVIFSDSIAVIVLALVMMTLILWAHRANIKRLFKGTETNSNIRLKMAASKERKAAAARAAAESGAVGSTDAPPAQDIPSDAPPKK